MKIYCIVKNEYLPLWIYPLIIDANQSDLDFKTKQSCTLSFRLLKSIELNVNVEKSCCQLYFQRFTLVLFEVKSMLVTRK